MRELYQLRLKQLGDPSIFTELYFCGSLHHPERINKIMSNGFSDEGKRTVKRVWKGVFFGKRPCIVEKWRKNGMMCAMEIMRKDVYCGRTCVGGIM